VGDTLSSLVSGFVDSTEGATENSFGSFGGAGFTFDGVLGMDVPFISGVPFDIRFGIFQSGSVFVRPYVLGSGAAASFVGDFGSTITWAGVTNLRDALGNPIETFDITSLSGTDYRNAITPVPEPAGVLLWLAGLAALAGRVRMKSSQA